MSMYTQIPYPHKILLCSDGRSRNRQTASLKVFFPIKQGMLTRQTDKYKQGVLAGKNKIVLFFLHQNLFAVRTGLLLGYTKKEKKNRIRFYFCFAAIFVVFLVYLQTFCFISMLFSLFRGNADDLFMYQSTLASYLELIVFF